MPYLRVALIEYRKPAKVVEKKRPECETEIAQTVRQWLAEDDLATAAKLALLGLA